MDWPQVVFMVIAIAGVLYWFKSDIKDDIKRLDEDVKGISNQMQASNLRMDQLYQASNQRIDQLYQMFIDLLKEGRKP